MPWDDIDNETLINALDTNSNAGGLGDADQVWVVFRTDAVAGDDADANLWVALIAPDANPYTPQDYDHTAGNALYRWAGTVQSPAGATNRVLRGPHAAFRLCA